MEKGNKIRYRKVNMRMTILEKLQDILQETFPEGTLILAESGACCKVCSKPYLDEKTQAVYIDVLYNTKLGVNKLPVDHAWLLQKNIRILKEEK